MYGREFMLMGMAVLVVAITLYYLYIDRKEVSVALFDMYVFVLLISFGYAVDRLYKRISERIWLDTHITLPVKKQYVNEQHIRPDEYREDFLEIYDKVQEVYQMGKVKGISLEELKTECLARIDKANTNQKYFLALRRFFAGLKNMHTAPLYEKYSAAAGAEWRGDSLYVITNYTKLPFMYGDRIVEVDGVDVLKWKEQVLHYTIASTDQARKYHTADYVFSSFIDTVRMLRVSREDSVFTVRVPLDKWEEHVRTNRKISDKEKRKPEKRIILSLDDFSDEAVGSLIYQLRSLRNRPYLIINVMNNPGGKVKNAYLLARFLLKHTYSVNKHTLITPDTAAYKGKLYMMMNKGTSSAAELLLNMLKETGSATLVGEETGGDFGTLPLKFKTSHDTYFCIGSGIAHPTVYGRPTEGVGVAPDIKIVEMPQLSNTKNTLLRTFKQIWIDKMKSRQDSLLNRM